MNTLTDRQRLVLEFICGSIRDRGYPPTLREIGLKLGIRSTNGVNDHLRALERKGYLTREDMKSRTLRPTERTLLLIDGDDAADGEAPAVRGGDRSPAAALLASTARAQAASTGGIALTGGMASKGGMASTSGALSVASTTSTAGTGSTTGVARADAERDPSRTHRGGASEVDAAGADDGMLEVPMLGRVAAGALASVYEQPTDSVRIDRMLLGVGARARGGDVFGLRIHGESMIEAGIHHGDYVFVRKSIEAPRGAIVIAMVGDEATCKYYFPESTHIRLQPANASMAPILVPRTDWRETHILGVVVGIYRKL